MHHDVFHHHNGIVNHQAHCGRQTAQGHQIETLAQPAQHDQRDGNSSRNHQARHNRTAPVPQEQHQDNRRQHEADENRIAHACYGFPYQLRLIVEGLQFHAGRQRRTNLGQFFGHQICHRDRIARRLPEDVQQHSGFCISRHDGIDRHHRRAYAGQVANTDGHAGRGSLHHDIGNFRRVAGLAGDQRDGQFVVILQQAGRIDHVAARNGIQNTGHRDLGFQQFGRVRLHLKLRHLPPLDHHHGNAVHAVQTWLDAVVRQLPKRALRD